MTIKSKEELPFLFDVDESTTEEEHEKFIAESAAKTDKNLEEWFADPLRTAYSNLEQLIKQVQIAGLLLEQEVDSPSKMQMLIAQLDAITVCNDALASVRAARAHCAVLRKKLVEFNRISALSAKERLRYLRMVKAKVDEIKEAAVSNRPKGELN